MNKVELEARVDALQDEINFLRAVYEAVREMERLLLYLFFFFLRIELPLRVPTLNKTSCAGTA